MSVLKVKRRFNGTFMEFKVKRESRDKQGIEVRRGSQVRHS